MEFLIALVRRDGIAVIGLKRTVVRDEVIDSCCLTLTEAFTSGGARRGVAPHYVLDHAHGVHLVGTSVIAKAERWTV